MTVFDKRIEKLRNLSDEVRAVQERRQPFAVVYLRSLLTGRTTLVYHPAGHSGAPERGEDMVLDKVPEWFSERPGVRCVVSLARCIECIYAFYQRSDLYTEEQKARFKVEAVERWPEVAALYDLEDPEAVIDALAEYTV